MNTVRVEYENTRKNCDVRKSIQPKIAISDTNPVLSESIRCLFLKDSHLSKFSIISDTSCNLKRLQMMTPKILILDPWQHVNYQGDITQKFHCLTSNISVIGYCPDISSGDARTLSLSGFRAILPKTVSGEELVRVVCAVAFGGVYLHESYAIDPAEPDEQADLSRDFHSGLTDREIDVLRHVALGCSMKEIAALLKISTKTVDTYKNRANRKLNLRSKTDIVKYAIKSGWLN